MKNLLMVVEDAFCQKFYEKAVEISAIPSRYNPAKLVI